MEISCCSGDVPTEILVVILYRISILKNKKILFEAIENERKIQKTKNHKISVISAKLGKDAFEKISKAIEIDYEEDDE